MIKKLKENYVGDRITYQGVNYTIIEIDDDAGTMTLRPDTEITDPDTFEGNSFYDITITLDELES